MSSSHPDPVVLRRSARLAALPPNRQAIWADLQERNSHILQLYYWTHTLFRILAIVLAVGVVSYVGRLPFNAGVGIIGLLAGMMLYLDNRTGIVKMVGKWMR
jgi:hypothetical protein